jgi:hypothetical protein
MPDRGNNPTPGAGGNTAGASPITPRNVLDILGCVLADIHGIAHGDPAYIGGPLRLQAVGKLEAIASLSEVTWHLHALTVQPLSEFGLLEAAVTIYRAAPIYADQAVYRRIGLALEQLAHDAARDERGDKVPRGSILNSSLAVQ